MPAHPDATARRFAWMQWVQQHPAGYRDAQVQAMVAHKSRTKVLDRIQLVPHDAFGAPHLGVVHL